MISIDFNRLRGSMPKMSTSRPDEMHGVNAVKIRARRPRRHTGGTHSARATVPEAGVLRGENKVFSSPEGRTGARNIRRHGRHAARLQYTAAAHRELDDDHRVDGPSPTQRLARGCFVLFWFFSSN